MGRNSESTVSSAVLQRACRNDADAWSEIVSHYAPKIYRWCRTASVPQQDTIDLTQDVLTQVFISLPDLSRDRAKGESLSAWLFSVTRNRVRDYYRQQNRLPVARGSEDYFVQSAPAAEPSSLSGPPRKIVRLYEILDAVRSDVDDSTWQAFWRLAIDGESVASIAADLKMSEGAVRQSKYRVMQKLHEEGM